MENITQTLETIKDTILGHVPAKYIYLFGSYAYGEPKVDSDIDIYVVYPDSDQRVIDLSTKINSDLGSKEIYSVDLFMNKESVFNDRIIRFNLEEIVSKKGKLLYENR